MRYILLFFLFSVIFSCSTLGKNAQSRPSGFAKIRFVDKNEDYSKTYLGKLTKGDLQSLKSELQNNFSDPQESVSEKNKNDQKGYVDRVTAQKLKKKWKGNNKRAKNDLLGNYVVEDEKSLAEIKEKKFKEQEERASKTKISENTNKLNESSTQRRPNAYLSKHYRITSKRIHNGQTIKKRAGYVGLIVKYKIREGNYVNTYINIVEDYLKEGSKYNLKYHGNESSRKYYLEFVSAPL